MRFSLLLIALLCQGSVWADAIYKTVGPDGKIVFSDKPPEAAKNTTKLNLSANPDRAENDPAKAALIVYQREVMIEVTARFCIKNEPETADAVKTARDNWMLRHEALREKKLVIVKEQYTREQLLGVAREAESVNEGNLEKVRNYEAKERTRWCQELAKRIAAPEMNLLGNLTLVNTLSQYKSKAK